jgi:hypothetical protein
MSAISVMPQDVALLPTQVKPLSLDAMILG